MRGQWIKSNRVTNFGDWGRVEYCPSGQHAIGVMVKYEEIGSTNDHTGINGIALLCAFRKDIIRALSDCPRIFNIVKYFTKKKQAVNLYNNRKLSKKDF